MPKGNGSKQGNNSPGERNIFTAIREAHPLIAYCENNGIHFIRIGRSYRANSPFTNAVNAFSINVDNPDLWHDFSVVDSPNHGDVLELCALLNHNGDKKQAMYELAPEGYRAGIDRYINDRNAEQQKVQRAHEALNEFPKYIKDCRDCQQVPFSSLTEKEASLRNLGIQKMMILSKLPHFKEEYKCLETKNYE